MGWHLISPLQLLLGMYTVLGGGTSKALLTRSCNSEKCPCTAHVQKEYSYSPGTYCGRHFVPVGHKVDDVLAYHSTYSSGEKKESLKSKFTPPPAP